MCHRTEIPKTPEFTLRNKGGEGHGEANLTRHWFVSPSLREILFWAELRTLVVINEYASKEENFVYRQEKQWLTFKKTSTTASKLQTSQIMKRRRKALQPQHGVWKEKPALLSEKAASGSRLVTVSKWGLPLSFYPVTLPCSPPQLLPGTHDIQNLAQGFCTQNQSLLCLTLYQTFSFGPRTISQIMTRDLLVLNARSSFDSFLTSSFNLN